MFSQTCIFGQFILQYFLITWFLITWWILMQIMKLHVVMLRACRMMTKCLSTLHDLNYTNLLGTMGMYWLSSSKSAGSTVSELYPQLTLSFCTASLWEWTLFLRVASLWACLRNSSFSSGVECESESELVLCCCPDVWLFGCEESAPAPPPNPLPPFDDWVKSSLLLFYCNKHTLQLHVTSVPCYCVDTLYGAKSTTWTTST